METAFLECNNLKEFIVNENNTTFCSLNGQLFTKDMTTLLFARNVQGEYKLPQGVTTIGYTAFLGCSSLTSVDIPSSVTSIGDSAFSGCSSLTSVDIPASVTSINGWAFEDCSALTSVVIPEGVTYIDLTAFSGCTSLTSLTIPKSVIRLGGYTSPGLNCKIIFLGYPPNRLGSIRWNDHIEYPSAYAEEWEHALLLARRSGGCNTGALVSVRAEMTTPKTMKVTYKVITFSRAKVRAVAWKDGVRSFANIIPVKTAAEGSPETVPNGEAVTAGVEHTFIWQVSADWNIDLAKVAVEVLAEDAGLLPQDLVTIPATEAHVAMTITTNVPTTYHLFNALVWHYADGDPALTVSNGVVKINGTQVANGTSLTAYGCNNTALLNYLYGKMGYKVLTGADLIYAREATEIEFANSGLNQVSVKISEE